MPLSASPTVALPVRRPRLRLPVVHVGLGLVVAVASATIGCHAKNGQGDQGARELVFDFRGKELPYEFEPFQVPDAALLQAEPEGLRITIPNSVISPPWGFGIKTKFGLKGDFEASAAIEVVHLDAPPSQSSLGVTFCLYPVDGGRNAATGIDRFVHGEGLQGIRWFSRKISWKEEAPCTSNVCTLGFKRTGATLHYQWSPGQRGDSFQEIGHSEWPNDIEHLRVAAFLAVPSNTQQKPVGMDLRLLGFRIRGDLQDYPVQPPGKGMLAAALLLAFIITVTSLAAWLFRRRSHKEGSPSSTSAT